MEILSDIPFKLDLKSVLSRIKLRRKNQGAEKEIEEVIGLVRPVAKPKVVYDVCFIENKDEDSVEISGVRFTSRLLRDNLDKVERVFPYIATCGTEVDAIDIPSDEYMKSFYLDQIKEMILSSAAHYLEEHLTERYRLGQISEMEPGSLESWPISQQTQLFSIFGDVENLIGVRLTDRFLMRPLKSQSGIFFPTEVKFGSCQLCPKKRCDNRKAPYNPELARKYMEK